MMLGVSKLLVHNLFNRKEAYLRLKSNRKTFSFFGFLKDYLIWVIYDEIKLE